MRSGFPGVSSAYEDAAADVQNQQKHEGLEVLEAELLAFDFFSRGAEYPRILRICGQSATTANWHGCMFMYLHILPPQFGLFWMGQDNRRRIAETNFSKAQSAC